MNREIKFRGQRIDNGEWVYGYYMFGRLNNRETLRKPYNFEYENAYLPYIYPSKKRWGEIGYDEGCSDIPFQVILKTVEQFTGLKDKNGKEIYEGDICKFIILQSETQKPINEQTVIISKENLSWGFKPTHPELVSEDDREWRPFYREEEKEMWDNIYFEVIGNIHENPELLEK